MKAKSILEGGFSKKSGEGSRGSKVVGMGVQKKRRPIK